MFSAPALSIGLADGDWRSALTAQAPAAARATIQAAADAAALQRAPRIVGWAGEDIDGDGAADLANPTGKAPRVHDAYGEGAFGASRDGGSRRHMGVDYEAAAGQPVAAPISGFVTKIGYVYAGDAALRYVEVDNPALKISARVFYVDPEVVVGQAVRLGRAIGRAQTLQAKYPGGITDHVHLELEQAGRKLDATALIVARLG